jgi:hypothetical protein
MARLFSNVEYIGIVLVYGAGVLLVPREFPCDFLWEYQVDQVSEVLPPDRKHPLIDLKLSKSSEVIVNRCRTLCKKKLCNRYILRFNSITARLIYIIFH